MDDVDGIILVESESESVKLLDDEIIEKDGARVPEVGILEEPNDCFTPWS